ncbi:AlbA family DNA-binding domain-containing protein [Fodinibius sediminis]|uniref:DNA-binding domain-containing protein n=1 Tax=Fodinibius sediminis TaxID=1214077 RepID=A0A521FIH2_9BACT|nr:ATP-binding protein [Fodinibius sediminis]SMO95968.1 Putative DNA-binding domain-containing protein [Fodinibius sediminis]
MGLDKELYEGFAKFFEKPTRTNLRDLLQSPIGELDQIDFKEELPKKDKLARHILAMGNSGNGVLIIGIDDSDPPNPVGMNQLKDKADHHKQLSPYLPDSLEYQIIDFSYTDSEYEKIKDKSFQVFIIESDEKKLPYLSKKAGNNIKDNAIYVRKGTNSTVANHNDLQRILNKRIESGYSSSNIIDVEEHLEQLKVLYSMISPVQVTSSFANLGNLMNDAFLDKKPNPDFPDESFEEFIVRAIALKKRKIFEALEI